MKVKLTKAHRRLWDIHRLGYRRLPLYSSRLPAHDRAMVERGWVSIGRKYTSWVEVGLTAKGRKLAEWISRRYG